jgi:hypothetical protein
MLLLKHNIHKSKTKSQAINNSTDTNFKLFVNETYCLIDTHTTEEASIFLNVYRFQLILKVINKNV